MEKVSTIGEEKRWNPRFVEYESRLGDNSQGVCRRNRASFIELMDNLDLPESEKMMEAIRANHCCGKVQT
ncbi:MAG: hypothetical protein ACFB02_10715 [Mastigocoleus sp.]